ncbi:MAG: cellulase family glycosylhydrolase [Fibrobacter sp.]|nr:cellulase family glycosylhydrolase [Fibrobacter sp.]
MKFILFIALLVNLALATPVQTHGALKVQNGEIVNKNGQPPQLRGMSLFWDIWNEGSTFYNSTTINHLADTWKVSVVRAAIGGGSVQNAKTIIDAAIANGIYVIVDWHKHGIETEPAKNFFREISSYVKNNHNNAPNVIYEIFNEPIEQNWSQIKQYAEQVIPVIRANSPDHIIVVGTPRYSSVITAPIGGKNDNQQGDIRFDVKDDFVKGSNFAYGFHFYASEAGHKRYQALVTKAMCNKVPIFITEWGISDASGDGAYDWNLIKDWVSYVESAKLSSAAWSIANKNESSAAMQPGSGANDVGNSGRWSESGRYLQSLISKLNQGQKHEDVVIRNISCETGGTVIERDEGGGTTNDLIQAEDFLESSNVTVRDESGAGGGKIVSSINSSSLLTYWIETEKEAPYTMLLKLRPQNSGGTINWSIGAMEGSWNFPDSIASNNWVNFRIPVQLPQGRDNMTLSFSGFNDNLDFDLFSFMSQSQRDSINFGFLVEDEDGNLILVPTKDRKLSYSAFSLQNAADGLWIKQHGAWDRVELVSLQGQVLYNLNLDQNNTLIPRSNLPKSTFIIVLKNAQLKSRSQLVHPLK